MYVYCENNPITRFDQNGNSWDGFWKNVKNTLQTIDKVIVKPITNVIGGFTSTVSDSASLIWSTILVSLHIQKMKDIGSEMMIHTQNVIVIGTGVGNVTPFSEMKIDVNSRDYIQQCQKAYNEMKYIDGNVGIEKRLWTDLSKKEKDILNRNMRYWDQNMFNKYFDKLLDEGIEAANDAS